MSSEASTDSSAQPPADALQPWQLFTLAGLIGATAVVLVSRGQTTPAGFVLLSLAIFAAALVGLAAWRMLAPFGGGTATGTQMLAGRTRAALEREKTLVLRAIKDLEFDRAMGKMSEKDFSEMSQRLRLRAAGLIRQLDAGAGYRDQIEKELARRIGAPVEIEAARPTAAACGTCGTANDGDARFCKNCGAALESLK